MKKFLLVLSLFSLMGCHTFSPVGLDLFPVFFPSGIGSIPKTQCFDRRYPECGKELSETECAYCINEIREKEGKVR
jgi:hypothetical protein